MIQFNEPYYSDIENQFICDAMLKKTCGDGEYTSLLSKKVRHLFDVDKFLFVTSGTSALEMSAILLDIKPGDEVIIPSYTFVSTANAFLLRGAKLVFADVEKDTMLLNIEDVSRKITKATKAVVPVHYAGAICDMDSLKGLTEPNNIRIIEDAAQAVGSRYKGILAGLLGDMGCYSFHETKNYSSGEGGGFLTRSEELFERAEMVREKGTNRKQFLSGFVDKYTWVDVGSSFIASDILAACLCGQLEKYDEIFSIRKRVFEQYYRELEILENNGLLSLPVIPAHCEINYHMFYMITQLADRDPLISFLRERGIQAPFHYIPLHTSPMGRKAADYVDLPVTEEYSKRLIRLPMHCGLSTEDVAEVVERILEFYKGRY